MGHDLDDLLAYTTEKKVVVRHRWLGGIYYVSMLGILAWVIFQLVYEKEYNDTQLVSGSIRASVKSPDAFRPLAALPYCAAEGAPTTTTCKATCSCVSWNQSMVSTVTPDVGLLIATRVKSTVQEVDPACDEWSYGCDPWLERPELQKTVFMGDVEGATVLVQHAASLTAQPTTHVASTFLTNRSVPSLKGKAGTVPVQKRCQCAHGTRTAPPAGCAAVAGCSDLGDVFTVGQLLQVLGISLEDAAPDGNPLRYEGLSVRIFVNYDSDSEYSYHASYTNITAKLLSTDRYNATLRSVQDTHGLQLLFVLGHGFPQFDARTLILTLVSGLALLSVAKTVADSFLNYAAPRKAEYRLFTHAYTPDLSPDSSYERELLQRILAEKHRKHKLKTSRSPDDLVGLGDPLVLNSAAAQQQQFDPPLVINVAPQGSQQTGANGQVI